MVERETVRRFWNRVNKRGPVPRHAPGLGRCWVWDRGCTAGGYGRLHVNGEEVYAHRLSWTMAYGAIPADKPCVCHHCDNPACVRPSHLWVGTKGDNLRDMAAKGRSGATVHPERYPKGDQHPSRLHPETRLRGESNGNSRLSEADVREIRKRSNMGEIQGSIAAAVGVHQRTIGRIVRGETWKHVI